MKKILFVLAVVGLFAVPRIYAQVSVGVRIGIAPPPLPVYVQPPCPVDGYLWEPGYWAYDNADGYYWVPGVWVAPPDPGLLWTPCYWGFDDGFYVFHSGYWGPHVGFYGGINYGFGYPGFGFYGGVWSGRSFRYNTAVFNVNRRVIHNTYVSRAGIHPVSNSRASFNGRGGVNVRPRPEDRRVMSEHHIQPTRSQMSHQQTAAHNRAQHRSVNHGHPATPAMNRVNSRSINRQGHVANGARSSRINRSGPGHINGHEANMGHATHIQQQRMQQPHMQQHMQQPRMQQHMQQPHMQQHIGGGGHMGGGPPHMGGGGPPRMGGGGHMGGGPPHMGGGGGGGHMGGGAPHGGGGGGHERR